MDNVDGIKLGHTIFRDIDSNPYLHELYESILYNYSVRLLGPSSDSYKSIDIEDALRFADILSKSNDPVNSDKHKIMAQEIVALLKNIHPENPTIDFYLGSVLSNTGNYRGLTLVAPNHQHGTLMDQFFTEFSKDYMRIPASPGSQFFRSQKAVYDRLNDSYFSYSGPTSMGKSFIMRMFIKEQVTKGIKANYALLVPTKALINEVSSSIINDLKERLAEYNYKIVTSAGALALKENHNFILVMTPERMLYLMISNPSIMIDFLFVDEAHKISSNDSRSPFYYKVVDMLSRREKKPKMIFASPNIPNPEIYLDLVPSSNTLSEQKLRSTFTPVSQMKFLIDFPERDIKLFNNYTGDFVDFMPLNDAITFNQLISYIGKGSQNIVYCHSTNKAVELALEFARDFIQSENKELLDLSRDITNEIHGDYYLADIISKGVAYHIGYLPSSIRMRIEELYRKGLIHTVFSTSTLVEGVNLPADNLFITHYKVGRTKMPLVDFKNLVGRVGRIEYNLFGNVFLVRLEEKTKPKEFMDLIMNEVPEQSLSLVSQLSDSIKQQIVNSLLEGNIEFHKQSGQNYNQYALMRKFAIILLRDITKGNNSFVRSHFQPFLDEQIESIIIENFSPERDRIDDDINVSSDQVKSLTTAIAEGLSYPELNENGNIEYQDLMSFLEKLCQIFKWDIYEKQTLGQKKNGKHGKLRWYAVILSQWIKGTGLSYIINQALEYKIQYPSTGVWDC